MQLVGPQLEDTTLRVRRRSRKEGEFLIKLGRARRQIWNHFVVGAYVLL